VADDSLLTDRLIARGEEFEGLAREFAASGKSGMCVTITYYAAIHYVDAFFSEKRPQLIETVRDRGGHGARLAQMKNWQVTRSVHKTLWDLREASEGVRYRFDDPDGSAAQSAIMLLEQIKRRVLGAIGRSGSPPATTARG
jgi:hypothetical protein